MEAQVQNAVEVALNPDAEHNLKQQVRPFGQFPSTFKTENLIRSRHLNLFRKSKSLQMHGGLR